MCKFIKNVQDIHCCLEWLVFEGCHYKLIVSANSVADYFVPSVLLF